MLVHAASIGRALNGAAEAQSAFGTIPAPADCGPFHAMPNINQQKKRVRSAARQRLENLRYRSTVKTLAKRFPSEYAGTGYRRRSKRFCSKAARLSRKLQY